MLRGLQNNEELFRMSSTRRTACLTAIAAALAFTTLAAPTLALAEAPMAKSQAPGWYRMKLGSFEVTALSDGTVTLAGRQAAVQRQARHRRTTAGAQLPEGAGGNQRQRLPHQHRQQAGADRRRRRRPLRPHAGQAGGQPEGQRLHARAGGRDLHHPHAPRPRRRPDGRRQAGVPERHRARRTSRKASSGSARPTWTRRRPTARASSRARWPR